MEAQQPIARRVSIRGVVQGVGFRPFVYRVAAGHHISGWVLNGAAGVEIHAEASPADMKAFLADLQGSPPPAARIAHFEVRDVPLEGFSVFTIRASQRESAPTVRISPDLAVCADCLRELNTPADRRYRYPYINCTNCGPRYSIIRQLPYDRASTTMASWALCKCCRKEYEDPLDRRYHAQPVACPVCGPAYRLVADATNAKPGDRTTPSGVPQPATGDQAIRRTAELLREGKIVAIKGIGGYHLACDARNTHAIEALRA